MSSWKLGHQCIVTVRIVSFSFSTRLTKLVTIRPIVLEQRGSCPLAPKHFWSCKTNTKDLFLHYFSNSPLTQVFQPTEPSSNKSKWCLQRSWLRTTWRRVEATVTVFRRPQHTMKCTEGRGSMNPELRELIPLKTWNLPFFRNFFVRLITSLYALIITIISLVVEVSPTWRTDMWQAETVTISLKTLNRNFMSPQIFYICMYGVGILFFAYCYIFIIYPGPYNYVISVLRRYKVIKNAEVLQ